MRTIRRGSEYFKLHDDGSISRPAIGVKASGQWTVTGAVRFNNFGSVSERYTLRDVLDGKLAWTHKNGKQRVHITDLDHGTRRIWMSPRHEAI